MIADEDREREAAYREWQRGRVAHRGPFPCVLRCESDDTCTQDHEHNPLPGYEDHVYGCECDGCMQWYRSLK